MQFRKYTFIPAIIGFLFLCLPAFAVTTVPTCIDPCIDNDGDGYGENCAAGPDCDDTVPGQGLITWYYDYDNDTYGKDLGVSCTTPIRACSKPEMDGINFSELNTDCKDNDPERHPGATDNSCDGIDQNCNGNFDENSTGPLATYYYDADHDTYGDPAKPAMVCTEHVPERYVNNSSDCDDDNGRLWSNTYYRDFDNDTFGNPSVTTLACSQPAGYVTTSDDCDDTVFGQGLITWYYDYDNDSYGKDSGAYCTVPIRACAKPEMDGVNFSELNTDCKDNDPERHPGATEACGDGIDRNCDGLPNNVYTFYRDADGDLFGDPNNRMGSCDNATPPHGYVDDSSDCNDGSALVHPGAADDTCNGKDEDCDGATDEGYEGVQTSCGAGVCAATGTSSCVAGEVQQNCTPGSGTTEVCNGIDDNCDGQTDEGLVFRTYYRDADNDTYGNADNATVACDGAPDGYVDNLTDDNITRAFDCNDNISTINPGAADTRCDGIDQNCDGQTDEGYVGTPTSCGVGECARTGITICSGGSLGDTCLPGLPALTDAVCDGRDADCDGWTDEDYVGEPTSCGIGACASTGRTSCDNGTVIDSCTPGYGVQSDSDCDGIDNDCNGLIDDQYIPDASCFLPGACAAGNVASSCAAGGNETPCATGTPTAETWNGIDDDCDGAIDNGFVVLHTYYRDADNDTYGNADNATVACTAPEGYVDNLTDDNKKIAFDCNDNDPAFTDNCPVCTDSDGDGYGENCAAGPDCNDSNASIHTGCDVSPGADCILKVVPKQILKLRAFWNPLIPFVISAESDSGVVFARPLEIDWGTEAIDDILRIKIGRRIIVGFLFARPLQLEAGMFEVLVTYGDNQTEQCGTIEVK